MPDDDRWSPSGPAFPLRTDDYSAVVRAVGAGLQRLRWRGRDLVLPYGDEELRPMFRGAVLAPWPNRVGGGRWTWEGEELQLPITEPERGHALHGLVCWAEWEPVAHDEASVVLRTTVPPQPGYPFHLELQVRWALDAASGLGCELAVVNRGPRPAPWGCSIHPYLVAPSGPLDSWVLEVPADRELLVDDALLPTELVDVRPEHDFRTPRPIGATQVDHAFTGLSFDGDGRVEVRLTDAAGAGARITFDRTTPWVQVCTSDWPGQPGHRAGVAVEPMTCPPNALATGTDLVVLAPGEEHRTAWQLVAV